MKYSRGVKRSRSRRSPRRGRSPRVNKRSYISRLIPIGFVAVVIGIVWWTGQSLFSSIWSEDISATIQISQGRAEFALEGNDEWTRALSDQQFLSGDTIRTKANTTASLELLDGYTFFINENTEIKFKKLEKNSSGEKTIEIDLLKGEIWASIPEDKTLKEIQL